MRGEQRGALAGNDVGKLEAAGADLGEIVVEPGRERGIDIDEIARGVDGEEAGRRVIEIVDGVLQFLEDVFLALAVARHVGDDPDGLARVAFLPSPSGRTRMRSQRAVSPCKPATRTSSCRRRPSRAALISR